MKKLTAFLALTTAAAHAHPGHPGHEIGDIGWGSHPVLGLAFLALLTSALFISRRAPRLVAGACATLAAGALFLAR